MLAIVSFPSAPFTENLVVNALRTLGDSIEIVQDLPEKPTDKLLQYSTYDKIDHELTHTKPHSVLSSSYIIRKALIRKHFLSRCISSYLTKTPSSILKNAAPRTWDIDIAWADELDDFFADELWDLAEELDSSEEKWFILKAGMADRGNGIRLFNSKETLRAIFEEFDEQSDEEDGDGESEQEIITSQLRHFVIQEYLAQPLLLDPSESGDTLRTALKPYKFHLRAYCVASGSLRVYLWLHILALFSGTPYSTPSCDDDASVDMRPHLTNTSFHTEHGESGVRLLSELLGRTILSSPEERKLTANDLSDIINQVTSILADTFRAALASPVHFQSLPNAFELFGIDFLVTHKPESTNGSAFQVSILEINSEPAIELTGTRLQWTLRDLHQSIARVCVAPFFGLAEAQEGWKIGETRGGFVKCLEEQVRGSGM